MKRERVHEWFARLAQEEPAAVAVSVRGEETTYGELAAGAQRVAAKLWAEDCGSGTIIGVLANESLSHITSMLGALNAGAAFAPLDPNLPDERLRAMLELIEPGCLIVEPGLLERADALCTAKMKMLRLQGVNLLDKTDGDHCPVSGGPDSLAYIYFTSGSSGVPKAIAGRLHGIDHFIRWEIEQLGLQRGVRVSQLLPLSFDGSLRDVFVALCSGGRVCVPPSREVVLEAGKLLEWLEAERVNVMHCVPSLFRAMVNEGLRAEQLSALRYILMAGEVLQPADVKRWMSVYGERVQLINLYGTTETTMAKFANFVKAADTERRFIPVGKPIPGARAVIVDEQGKACPPGTVGEIYIRTPYRSLGYYRQPQLTAEVFIQNPFSNDSADIVYKTGDLGRQLEDGNYEYVGRRDGQVKVRGQRVELGEIEAILCRHERVKEAVVLARPDETGAQRLVAYVVAADDREAFTVTEMHSYLREKLPHYMIPVALVQLSEMPLTPNGKVDRRALPEPDQDRVTLGIEYAAPRTGIEEILVNIWTEVLAVKQVGIHDNFFELGGHSLLATQVVSRVRRAFSIELPLRALFEAPTVMGLALRVESAMHTDEAVPPLRAVARVGDLPLSFAQQRLWFIEQLEPGSATYNIATAVRLTGELDVASLQRALSEVVRRHEALRTTFPMVDSAPVQRISPSQPFELPLLDLSGLAEQERELERFATEEARRPFDLAHGPLFRVKLVRVAENEHTLFAVMHHIISDGWSLGVLIREVATLYDAYSRGRENPLPELTIQYADYAAWQREWLSGEVLENQLAYWRDHLAGAPTMLDLPTDYPRQAMQTFNGTHQSFRLPAALSASLDQLSKKEGVTLFMTLLAAFNVLLSWYTGQKDIVLGTGVANRTRIETESLIGFFVNTVVLRTDLSGGPSFRELLRRVRETTLGAYAHQDIPFDMLVEALQPERNPSYTPLFQVMFLVQNMPLTVYELPGLQVSVQGLGTERGISKFDMYLAMSQDSEGLAGTLEYNTDLFAAASVTRLLGYFETLLEEIVADPDKDLDGISLLTDEDSDELIYAFNE
ncbi:MAG TPA: amino acid adenylation domain-containing protein [Pyrinomonadaceae bacterium]|nr:amino acid adenylation domain-containing protein [Pyrinomonadaceae bacterium]